MRELIITTKEAREIDQKTCKVKGISNLDLIKSAGLALSKMFLEKCQPNKNCLITILAGSGHNGADSLIMGQILQSKFQVKFIILEKKENLKPENNLILKDLEAANIHYLDQDNLSKVKKLIRKSDYIIDGIFGTGLNKEINGYPAEIIDVLNPSTFIFSIDIPSGIGGDNGLSYGKAIKANLTAIIQNYKVGNLLNEADDYHGEKVLIDIGLLSEDRGKYLLKKENILRYPKRKHYSHKYHYGNLLIIGGSPGMVGAPFMAALAALRSGAGLSSVAYPIECTSNFKMYPEIISHQYSDFEKLKLLLNKRNAIAFGPGLGKNNPYSESIIDEILSLDIPTVIDADGIYYLKPYLEKHHIFKNLIITPHLGELSILTGIKQEELEKRNLEVVRELVEKHRLIIVLKGPCTIIADEEETWFSNTGNPGMATAGSGDVLTGIITSLLAQGFPPLEAAKTGVYLHSLAGSEASKKYGEAGMIATDIIDFLPETIKKSS